jgi:transposase
MWGRITAYAERDQQIVRINAENEALARAAAQAEAREIIALATAKAAEHAAVIAEAKAAEMEDSLGRPR